MDISKSNEVRACDICNSFLIIKNKGGLKKVLNPCVCNGNSDALKKRKEIDQEESRALILSGIIVIIIFGTIIFTITTFLYIEAIIALATIAFTIALAWKKVMQEKKNVTEFCF